MVSLLSMGCGRSSDGEERPPRASVELTDAQQVFDLLGGSPSNAGNADEVLNNLGPLPQGSIATRSSDTQRTESGDLRVDETPYELRVPGQPPNKFLITRVFGRAGQEWLLIAVFVGLSP